MADLNGLCLCVMGGDRREVELVRVLAESGANVRSYGVPQAGLNGPLRACSLAANAEEACAGADAIILPLSGTDASGCVRISASPVCITRELLSVLRPGAALFSGTIVAWVRDACAAAGVRMVETGNDDELAILNSIPSAEGAIQMAMQATPFTIHGSNCLVLGLGRTGATLARMLRGIGANVWAAARKPKDRARATEMCLAPVSFSDLPACLPQMDIVFNTVPAVVLNRELIYVMRRTAVIIDLASAPGGTDFASAAERGIHAELAPGLPGKAAPLTAGRILSRVIPEIVEANLRRS
ncbi:MAG: dipicolinate synthase subunit DpsA [Clostridia bacterium]|nr:dipicolinate synthase subunit DpsA [Clostridia bacterium]